MPLNFSLNQLYPANATFCKSKQKLQSLLLPHKKFHILDIQLIKFSFLNIKVELLVVIIVT